MAVVTKKSKKTGAVKTRASKKVTKKNPAKVEEKKTETKISTRGYMGKDLLRKPQIELLKILNSCNAIKRVELSKKHSGITEHLGKLDGTSGKHTICLLEKKLAKQYVEQEDDKSVVYVAITAAGKKALANEAS